MFTSVILFFTNTFAPHVGNNHLSHKIWLAVLPQLVPSAIPSILDPKHKHNLYSLISQQWRAEVYGCPVLGKNWRTIYGKCWIPIYHVIHYDVFVCYFYFITIVKTFLNILTEIIVYEEKILTSLLSLHHWKCLFHSLRKFTLFNVFDCFRLTLKGYG